MKEHLHSWAVVLVLAVIAYELHTLNGALSYPSDVMRLSTPGSTPLEGIAINLDSLSSELGNIAGNVYALKEKN